jgi:beta-lactamase superfamily II metal-dependent hydrolase
MHLMSGLTPTQPPDIPETDEIEVTLFGSGYGESVVVHIGSNKWLIIDSTIHRDTREPAAIKYLESIGVDVSKQVVGVIVTHWHDDHIRGISTIAENCLAAKFYISAALMSDQNRAKFLTLLYDSPVSRLAHLNAASSSGVAEFTKLIVFLREKNNRPAFVMYDQLLIDPPPIQLWALSPHSSVFEKAMDAIISQIPDKAGCVRRLRAPRPNHTSVALWLKFGHIRVLLGADLEECPEHPGWSLIISERKISIIDCKAELFKVAHHGSDTGHHDSVWTDILAADPVCLIAPFNRNPKLPKTSDIARITKLSSRVYITSISTERIDHTAFIDKSVYRKLEQRNAAYIQEKYSYVRGRKKGENGWVIETHGNSRLLS